MLRLSQGSGSADGCAGSVYGLDRVDGQRGSLLHRRAADHRAAAGGRGGVRPPAGQHGGGHPAEASTSDINQPNIHDC